MKAAVVVARTLLGLLFVLAGLNHLHPFGHQALPPGDAGTMMALMNGHGWFLFYGFVEAAAGLMLVLGRFVPLGLTLLAGLIVNIMLLNATLAPPGPPIGIVIGLVIGLLEIFLVYAYRASFAGIFAAKAQPSV